MIGKDKNWGLRKKFVEKRKKYNLEDRRKRERV